MEPQLALHAKWNFNIPIWSLSRPFSEVFAAVGFVAESFYAEEKEKWHLSKTVVRTEWEQGHQSWSNPELDRIHLLSRPS